MEGMKCYVCFIGVIEKIHNGYFKCPNCEEEFVDRYAAKEAMDKILSQNEGIKEKATRLFKRIFSEDNKE